MTDVIVSISQTIFTASITAASLTFIIITQIMIWVENNIENERLQGYIKISYDNLGKTIPLFLISNIMIIIYWGIHSLLFHIDSFQIYTFVVNTNYLVILSLVIFLYAVGILLLSVRSFLKLLFKWKNNWRIG